MDQMWGSTDPDELREVWAEGLAPFAPGEIKGAISMLEAAHPDFPPTLFQFVGLCRDARRRLASESTKLAGPLVPMPDHAREKLREVVANMRARYRNAA